MSVSAVSKHYPFRMFEERVAKAWNETSSPSSLSKERFVIMMPPPNVTGRLHLGHTLSSTLQDIIVRFKRMQGANVVWVPGLDHAGISVQMMVERQVQQEGTSRQQLGREAFVARVWDWKERYGGEIIGQMKRLGFAADWDRLCFTLDEGFHHAVITAFVRLYKKGLVYKARRLVNWDPSLKTALSDLEVVSKEQKGTLWTIRYLLVAPDPEGPTYIDVATTRPETLFGDVAVAVHPDDPRYRAIVGKEVYLPLTDRRISIITDEGIDREKGTGALKVTPAHDVFDFEIGVRNKLPFVEILDKEACLCGPVPAPFMGQERFTARKMVLEALREKGLLIVETPIVHAIPLSERSGMVVEPMLTEQWFVDMQGMARAAIQAVDEGKIKIAPLTWENVYFEWLENIRPWCISRQLWWGHRIPVWYGPDGQKFSEATVEEAYVAARQFYRREVHLTQDEDVLDTWFSSALWTFASFGWPEQKPDLKRYHPTDLLITGHDILFFWVARMAMMTLEMTGEVPFRQVYLHPLIRDERGQKMSKTKGNVIDPLDLVDEYGADAVRLAMALVAAPVRAVRFGVSHVEQARNFITKLWNAGRFCLMHGARVTDIVQKPTWLFNVWILAELSTLVACVTELLGKLRFHEAALMLYGFVRGTFCDWYVELAKDGLAHGSDVVRREVKATLGHVFGELLALLHPMIPFVTEEIWTILGGEGLLCQGAWPSGHACAPLEEVSAVIECVGAIRRLRSSFSIPFSTLLKVRVEGAMDALFVRHAALICRLVNLSELTYGEGKGGGGSVDAHIPLSDGTLLVVSLDGIVDIAAERARLLKEIAKRATEASVLRDRIEAFVGKAPPEVVEDLEERLEVAQTEARALRDVLSFLERT